MWWFIAGTSVFLIVLGTALIAKDLSFGLRLPRSTAVLDSNGSVQVAGNVAVAAPIELVSIKKQRSRRAWLPRRLAFWRRSPLDIHSPWAMPLDDDPATVAPAHALLAAKPGPRKKLTVMGEVVPPLGVRGLMDVVLGVLDDSGDFGEPMTRTSTIEARWRQVAPQLEVATIPLNELLSSVALVIAPQGEMGWSPRNQGFGVYRRLQLAGQSIAWLRTEVQHDGSVMFKVRAQARGQTMLNRQRHCTEWPLTETMAANELATVLQPIAEYAAWLQTEPQVASEKLRRLVTGGVASSSASQNLQEQPTTVQRPALSAGRVAAQPRIEVPQQHSWRTVKTVPLPAHPRPAQVLIDAAIGLVNGAFVEVGASLVLRDSRDAPSGQVSVPGQHAYHIMVQARSVGLVVIAETPTQIDISVGVSDPALLGLAKHQTVTMPQSYAYALAEAIATCVWPSIASVGAGVRVSQ